MAINKNFHEFFDQNDFETFDQLYASEHERLGVKFNYKTKVCTFKFWQPIAKAVNLIFYDFKNLKKIKKIIPLVTKKNIWVTKFPFSDLNCYYRIEILHQNDTKTWCLDPYAYSMARFNWNGSEDQVGYGFFADVNNEKLSGKKPRKLKTKFNHTVDPVIYELHIRDFTSLKQGKIKSKRGTFLAALETKIFNYLKKLNVNYLELLPIQATYTINDYDQKILKKGAGKNWTTNYNWGYDPHNYFTINGWYSSNPKDPYARIRELKKLIDEAHKNNIGIILDVVYNHVMTNNIFNNILPNYYFRNSQPYPVNQPSLASERLMVRKLIIDSLVYLVKNFNVDGFRFDLASFIDKNTIDQIVTTLRKINPKIVLSGEAWEFSNLDYQNTYIKGHSINQHNFAYFNDTILKAIKGYDNHQKIDLGLIHGNLDYFPQYVSCVKGNLNDLIFWKNSSASQLPYDNFASNPGDSLQYSSCHDGFTLWDKINITSQEDFITKIEQYRQALMMQFTAQGRQLILAGTELLQSKPLDQTGDDSHRYYSLNGLVDIFNYQPDNNGYCDNSYKTTDYVNGIKWQNLNHQLVKKHVFTFLQKLIKFRQQTPFFRLKTKKEILEQIEILVAENGILIYQITVKKSKILVAHNFTSENLNNFAYWSKNILFHSKIKHQWNQKILDSNSSIIVRL